MKLIDKFHEKTSALKTELEQHPRLQWLGNTLKSPYLWHFEKHAVAKGTSMGLFAAFLPLPMQMLLAVILSLCIRGNVLIAALMTWITNPITFVPINYFIYRVGRFFVEKNGGSFPLKPFPDDFTHFTAWLKEAALWLTHLGKPFLIGLPIVAVSAAICGYFIVLLGGSLFPKHAPTGLTKKDGAQSKDK